MDAGCASRRQVFPIQRFPRPPQISTRWPRAFFVRPSLGLSPPIETRQTRHLGVKPLIPQGRSMSGSSKKPAINPTFPAKNPTIDRRLGADAIPFSQSSHYSESPARPPLGFENPQIGTERANCSTPPPRYSRPCAPRAGIEAVVQIVAKFYSRGSQEKILGICNGSIYTSAWP